jgi:predicted alpha-1,6-mannanase (GH76 family)
MIVVAKAECRSFLFRASLWLVIGLFWSQAARGEIKAKDDYYANTLTSAKVLQQWYNEDGLWDSAGWWNGANCLEAIESVIEATNGREYRDVLRTTFEKNSGKDFLNEYYDDEGWWALAWIRAYDLTGERRYLAMAEKIFDDMKGGWDDHCNGGIWWKKEHRYKNAIANELFLLTAIRLHQRAIEKEKAGSYLDWAKREWAWFKQTGMINTNNLVNDGLNRYCENNGRTTWTYNQGVIIGGLVELYRSTGDTNCLTQAVAIADEAIKTLTDSKGVLAEPRESEGLHGADVPQFKGIFIRHLTELYDVTGNWTYRAFLIRNAQSVWRNDRDQTNRFGGHWGGPIDATDAIRHSSAMRAITALAEPVTTNLIFIRTATSPDFRHEVGVPAGSAAWTCDKYCQAGYVLAGPGLTSLPVGVLNVQFRMSVGRLSLSEASLVRLEVCDLSSGTVLSHRDIAWKEFQEVRPQSFSVAFTNSVADKPLQFRIYWNQVPKSPSLMVWDVSVGGDSNWSAANLNHEVGRLDRFNHWSADPIRDKSSGFLVKGPGTTELSPGEYDVCFELKVDNFNRDDSTVATISVMDVEDQKTIAMRELRRSDFANTLYHTFPLHVKTDGWQRLDFRTFWHYGTNAPQLTQRSVVVKPHTKDLVRVIGQ